MPELLVTLSDLRACGLTLADMRGHSDTQEWRLPEIARTLLTAELIRSGFDVQRPIAVTEQHDPVRFALKQ